MRLWVPLLFGFIASASLSAADPPFPGWDELDRDSSRPNHPVIRRSEISGFDLARVKSNWIELGSKHTLIPLPISLAIQNQANLAGVMDFFDEAYRFHSELAEWAPYNRARIRLVPGDYGWFASMGNPIHYAKEALTTAPGADNILRVLHSDYPIWGWLLEVGHVFFGHNFANARMLAHGDGMGEAWPNLFVLYTLERLGRTDAEKMALIQQRREAHLKNPRYEGLFHDPFVALPFLMEFQKKYGWDFYKALFRLLRTYDGTDFASFRETEPLQWLWIRNLFNLIAGEDTSPIFRAYGITLFDEAMISCNKAVVPEKL